MQRIVLSAFLTSTSPDRPGSWRGLCPSTPTPPQQPSGRARPASARSQPRPGSAMRPAAPKPRPSAAPPSAEFGGGFLRSPVRRRLVRSDQRPSAYGNQDLGPGMVESPYSPGRPVVDPRYMRQEVAYDGKEEPGTIIVNTNQRMLYLVQANGRAIRYGIGVGRPGFTWAGTHHVTNKREWPDWTPPPEMLQRRPDLPRHMVGRSRQSARRARALSRLDALSHPRLERALDDRHAGVVGLHPDAQRGRRRPLQPGQGRHQGGRDADPAARTADSQKAAGDGGLLFRVDAGFTRSVSLKR